MTDLAFFTTPSGNIDCELDPDNGARCDVVDHTWAAPPAPADCDLDWGNGLYVSPDGATGIVCAGDTVQDPDARVLAYGASIEAGDIRCTSATSGITCTDLISRHGFTLSRGAYQLS